MNEAAPTLWRLFGAWLMIGTQSFGGGGATLALIHQSLVERRGWVSEEDFPRDWALCQIVPGINLLAFAARLGGRIGGSCGTTGAAATGVALSLLGLLLPSVGITLAITGIYAHVRTSSPVQAALGAVIPVTVGLGLLTAGNMARPLLQASRTESRTSAAVTLVLLVGAGLAQAFLNLPMLATLLTAGVFGAIYQMARARTRT